MSDFDCFGTCDKLIVGCLIHYLFTMILWCIDNARISIDTAFTIIVCLVVDFIKCHPVFYFIFIAFKTCFRKFHK